MATLNDKAVGDIVKIKENGTAVNYIIVHKGLPSSMYDSSCNGVWVLREQSHSTMAWDAGNTNDYENSDVKTWLNGTFLNTIDSKIRAAIKNVKIPYKKGLGSDTSKTVQSGSNGLSCKVFLLSGYEVGFTTSDDSYLPIDGAKLSYFSDANSRICKDSSNTAVDWWFRSPSLRYDSDVWFANTGGRLNSGLAHNTGRAVRPAFVLPSSLLVGDDGNITITPPTTPKITVPETAQSGNAINISWTASTDAENNLAGYALERQIDGGSWTEIYRGNALSYSDNITGNWSIAQYRVRAYDTTGEYSGYATAYTKEQNAIAKISTGNDVFYLPNTGEWEVSIAKDGETATETVECTEYKDYAVNVAFVHIYGASWDGTSTTAWTRTDEAADFTDPVPYVAGVSNYGSPFDNIQPWAGMVKVNRTGGAMIAIPKFWYKLTQNGAGMKIQIADKATTGFSVSPAHMDRGDGKGERDVVYVGRYHCGTAYKSTSGQNPKNNITRSDARTEIHKLGSNIWQSDFAMRFTIWLLYIVEFADWNTQVKIGYGCGNDSAVGAMGYTDSMPYHTGTTQSARTTYGLGTQYRYIEGLWDNVYDWCDGCYYNNSGLNIILNPSNFSDNANGTLVGKPSSGYPSAFGVKTVSGLPDVFIPTAANGSESTYSCDYWDFCASYPCLHVGGSYDQGAYCGLFCVGYYGVSYANASVGCRLQELP